MAILTLSATQSAFLTSLEQPCLDAFGDGISAPGGNPPFIPPFKGFNDYSADIKLQCLNGIKSTLGPLIKLIIKDPESVTTVTSFLNGFGVWGDGRYGNGVLRYYKDNDGYVRLHGLFRTPANGATIGLAAFNLPAGFRPAVNDRHIFAAVANNEFCAVEIDDAGNVSLRSSPANDIWVSLECRFLAGG